jgi:predicted ribonuclease YlaK
VGARAEEPSLSALARIAPDRAVRPLRVPPRAVSGLVPRNKEQHFALDALLDPEVSLVTLMGKAGTGKTLLAIAAGLHQVEEAGTYGRLLVSRPIFPMGNDLGYLPGEIEEKLNPWMQPIYDNLEFLLERQKGRKTNSLSKLLADGTIGIEPLTYIRGRSIPGQFLVVDEAQNLTPLEVKTIITRVGEGTKIVLTGDLQQIDNPYVDAWSNGFNYLVQKFRAEPLAPMWSSRKGGEACSWSARPTFSESAASIFSGSASAAAGPYGERVSVPPLPEARDGFRTAGGSRGDRRPCPFEVPGARSPVSCHASPRFHRRVLHRRIQVTCDTL